MNTKKHVPSLIFSNIASDRVCAQEVDAHENSTYASAETKIKFVEIFMICFADKIRTASKVSEMVIARGVKVKSSTKGEKITLERKMPDKNKMKGRDAVI